MNASSAPTLAMVLEDDADAAATLAVQLQVLGVETHHSRHVHHLVDEVMVRRPRLVAIGLAFGDHDHIVALRHLAECRYSGKVLLLSGVERKVARIAERLGESLGLDMLVSLDKPMRLAELRERLACLEPTCREVPARLGPRFRQQDLERAFASHELILHYQPQFDLATRRLSGVEALVRWRHPEAGLLAPGEFLPLLSAVQGRQLTRRVLQMAMSDAAGWRRAGVHLSLSLNVTPDDLLCPELVNLVRARWHASGGTPLVLEIIESSSMEDELLGSEVATRLHLSGLEVSVDDFGVGYSSLSRLQRLPISELKIDRSFVSRVHEDVQDAAIVEAVALLGRRLGIRVVAEGVEDLACLGLLERFGCTHVQGFGLARPMAASEIPALARRASPLERAVMAG
ncbi:EAL domain-containing response regulator [Halomonas organivorans]|uniref:EAL domain-containing protein (Putative c-di-GMP-specific phosphodiesterase class I) n=1 Tax=Halomonas organivorans TaxID=257772 RepID=A0A7W5G3M4_9GAMM|nr:EAL domain-containing response regulator [Halomonas organivorans]MBB3139458.1 EAL domain-containing protein (putative c-di-GMP-specific phosphodiesterase class I) [Halomonas organivorans]